MTDQIRNKLKHIPSIIKTDNINVGDSVHTTPGIELEGISYIILSNFIL